MINIFRKPIICIKVSLSLIGRCQILIAQFLITRLDKSPQYGQKSQPQLIFGCALFSMESQKLINRPETNLKKYKFKTKKMF